MPKYRVSADLTYQFHTDVEANSEEEAKEVALPKSLVDRERIPLHWKSEYDMLPRIRIISAHNVEEAEVTSCEHGSPECFQSRYDYIHNRIDVLEYYRRLCWEHYRRQIITRP